MQCTKHPEHVAAGVCAYSGKPFCADELVEVEGRMYARENLSLVFAAAKATATTQQQATPAIMPTIVVNNTSSSSASSVATAAAVVGSPVYRGPRRQKAMALVLALCMFFGLGGLHRFYTGHTVIGVIQLLTFGGFFVWGIFDILAIAGGSYRDAQGNVLV